jgi:hypothetical protein
MVESAFNHGLILKAVNLESFPDYSYEAWQRSVGYDVSDVRFFPSAGQTKLFISDMSAIIRFNPSEIIVFGSAPGTHWQPIVSAFPSKKFIFIDPRPTFVGGSNVTVLKRFANKDDTVNKVDSLLLSDIREDPQKAIPDYVKFDGFDRDSDYSPSDMLRAYASGVNILHFVDGSRKADFPNLKVRNGFWGLHAIRGVFQGRPFSHEGKPYVVETFGDWVLIESVGRFLDIILD